MRSHSVKDGMKTCRSCKLSLPASAYYVWGYTTNQGKRSQRIESQCKGCAKAKKAASHAANREANNAASRAYKKNNLASVTARAAAYRSENAARVRATRVASQAKRRASCSMPAKDVRELFARVMDEAFMCGGWMDSYSGRIIQNPTIDHIVPVSRGGKNEYENLCVTSKENNSRKQRAPLLLWLTREYHV